MTSGDEGRVASDAEPSDGSDLHRCARCLQWKPATEFHNSRRQEFTYCRDCRNSYDRQYYAERGGPARRARRRAAKDREREWMNSLKEGIPCADCAGVFPVFVMQWDHLPGFDKVGEIASMLGCRRERVLQEVAKCQLVCANCHMMRTVARMTKLGQYNEFGRGGRIRTAEIPPAPKAGALTKLSYTPSPLIFARAT